MSAIRRKDSQIRAHLALASSLGDDIQRSSYESVALCLARFAGMAHKPTARCEEGNELLIRSRSELIGEMLRQVIGRDQPRLVWFVKDRISGNIPRSGRRGHQGESRPRR